MFPEITLAIARLREAGYRLCVASNFDARLRRVAEGLPDLEAWGDAIVVSSEVGYRKPHRRFYEAACTRLGLPPARVVCVGDDLENDFKGPTRAGLLAALIERGSPPRGDVPSYPGLGEFVDDLLAARRRE